MIEEINKAWSWKGFVAIEMVSTNKFGNAIFKVRGGAFWRICPEELSCEQIAEDSDSFLALSKSSEFIEDWEMANLVILAKRKLGGLVESERYCLKMPAVLGGEYSISNLGKISFNELIAFSGDLGFQIKDLKDGQKIKLKVIR